MVQSKKGRPVLLVLYIRWSRRVHLWGNAPPTAMTPVGCSEGVESPRIQQGNAYVFSTPPPPPLQAPGDHSYYWTRTQRQQHPAWVDWVSPINSQNRAGVGGPSISITLTQNLTHNVTTQENTMTGPSNLKKILKPWLGGPVGWSVFLYNKRLWVRSPVGVRTRGNQWRFSLTLTFLFLSLSLSFFPFLSKINKNWFNLGGGI